MHRFAVPSEMGNATARLLAAVLLAVAFYLTAVLVWRGAARRSVRLFFAMRISPQPRHSLSQAHQLASLRLAGSPAESHRRSAAE